LPPPPAQPPAPSQAVQVAVAREEEGESRGAAGPTRRGKSRWVLVGVAIAGVAAGMTIAYRSNQLGGPGAAASPAMMVTPPAGGTPDRSPGIMTVPVTVTSAPVVAAGRGDSGGAPPVFATATSPPSAAPAAPPTSATAAPKALRGTMPVAPSARASSGPKAGAPAASAPGSILDKDL